MGRTDKVNLDQGSNAKSRVSAVSALGMPCTYFLQKMVLLLTLFPFTSPFLTLQCQATCQTFTLATGLSLWPCQWVMDGCPSLGVYGLHAQQGSAGSSLHFLWASPDLTPCVED